MARPAGARKGRRGSGRGEGRDGVGGTRVTKGAGKVDSGEAATGRKVEEGFAFMCPDRKKLCHGRHNKLRIGSGCNFH